MAASSPSSSTREPGRAAALRLKRQSVQLLSFRGDKVARTEVYGDLSQGRAAAGLGMKLVLNPPAEMVALRFASGPDVRFAQSRSPKSAMRCLACGAQDLRPLL